MLRELLRVGTVNSMFLLSVVFQNKLRSPHDESLSGLVGWVSFSLVSKLRKHFDALFVLFITEIDDVVVFLLVFENIFICDLGQSVQGT